MRNRAKDADIADRNEEHIVPTAVRSLPLLRFFLRIGTSGPVSPFAKRSRWQKGQVMGAKTIYLVKKDAGARKKDTEWMELTREEFFAFLKTDSAKDRYFVRLRDDYPHDGGNIVIESSREDFLKWKREYNRQNYLSKSQKKAETLSINAMKESDFDREISLRSLYGLPEKEVIRAETLREIFEAVSKLSRRDQTIFNELYDENGDEKTNLTKLGRKYGFSRQYAGRLQKQMFEHLRELLDYDPEDF